MKEIINTIAATSLGVICFVAVAVCQTQTKRTQPISLVAGEWRVTYFVMGGGVATFGNCDVTKIAVASDNSIGLSLGSLPCPHETVKRTSYLQSSMIFVFSPLLCDIHIESFQAGLIPATRSRAAKKSFQVLRCSLRIFCPAPVSL